MTYTYKVRKRRKRGREGVEILRKACRYIHDTYCNPGFTLEHLKVKAGLVPFMCNIVWESEADVEAARLLLDLQKFVEAEEAYAMTENPAPKFIPRNYLWEGDSRSHKTKGRI